MMTSEFDTMESLKAFKEELTFERFNMMKENWLQNIRNEWLIMGHLTEEEALDIVKATESKLKYKPLNPNLIPTQRLV
jgi:secreted Zn-dependent insulinase-like peptidase